MQNTTLNNGVLNTDGPTFSFLLNTRLSLLFIWKMPTVPSAVHHVHAFLMTVLKHKD